jgi:hypothetical protein
MRRENVHVNASRKTFKNIYARFHTFYRMGASQERAAFFNAKMLVVTRHPGGPPGRPKIHPVLPRFALFFIHNPEYRVDRNLALYKARGAQQD